MAESNRSHERKMSIPVNRKSGGRIKRKYSLQ